MMFPFGMATMIYDKPIWGLLEKFAKENSNT